MLLLLLLSGCSFNHSHKKRKDSLETRTKAADFSLNNLSSENY